MTYRRILVATDLSEPAAQAAQWAKRLASPDAHVRVAFVAPLIPVDAATTGVQWQSFEEAERRALQDALKTWSARAELTGAEEAILMGSVPRELSRAAESFDADLVVVGSRGHSRLERLLLGSTARGVIRHVQADTLIARGTAPAKLTRVLQATDLHPAADHAAKRAAAIAQAQGAQTGIVHVMDTSLWSEALRDVPAGLDDATIEKVLRARVHDVNRDRFGGRAQEILARGKPAAEVARVATEWNADLVVIGDHGAKALERALMGSVAESIVERAPCSVLVARAQE